MLESLPHVPPTEGMRSSSSCPSRTQALVKGGGGEIVYINTVISDVE